MSRIDQIREIREKARRCRRWIVVTGSEREAEVGGAGGMGVIGSRLRVK